MSNFMSHFLVPAAIVAVAIVLLLGLINMMRGGSPNRSQKLMRLRVLLQVVGIIVIMATNWLLGPEYEKIRSGRSLHWSGAHILLFFFLLLLGLLFGRGI